MSTAKFTTVCSLSILEKLSSAGPNRPACLTCCGLASHCQTPYLKPYIPTDWTRKILGVGEAPGEHEDKESGRPFTGPSGRLLYRMLRAAGFKDRDLALVNAVRCHPRGNQTPSMRQLRACRPFLLRVIEQLRPAVVVCFGSSAAKAVLDRGATSVTELRGRVLELRFVPQPGPVSDAGTVGEVLHQVPGLHELGTESPREFTVPFRVTYHPAAILRGATHLQKRVIDDLRRIRKSDRRELDIVSEPLTDKVLSVDTEYSPYGELLTVALSGRTKARVWDIEGSGGTA